MRYSILIPTYRRPQSFAATLKSLFSLDLTRVVEVFVHVTGSRAGSLDEHCEWLIGRLESTGVLVHVADDFADLAEAKNAAIDKCAGVWLLILDDDVLINEKYMSLLRWRVTSRSTESKVMAVTGTVHTPFEAGYAQWSQEKCNKVLKREDTYQRLTVAEDGRVDWGDKVQVFRYGYESTCSLGYFIGGAVLLRMGDGCRFDLAFGRVVYGEEIDYSLQINAAGGRIAFAIGAECLHFPCPTGGSKPATKKELVAARQKNFDYLLRKWGLSDKPAYGFEARDAARALA